MNQNFLCAAALASLACATGAQAAPSEACAGIFSTVQVTVTASEVNEAPVTEVDVATLTTRSKPHAEVGSRVLGAATATRASVFRYRYLIADLADGQICVQPRVEINLGYRPLAVEVASELQGHDCLRDAVLLHEQEHVQVYKRHAGGIRTHVHRVPWRSAILVEATHVHPARLEYPLSSA